jgi:cyclophilin family peptidyl-prolyl cis-trans isomerase/HEAT repeat protein
MKKILIVCFAVFCFSLQLFAQNVPTATLVNIVKAEDERRFDRTLEDLLKNRDEKIRVRTALAAGRIGDERAVLLLANLLETDSSTEVRAMAAFSLGEIESIKAADAITKTLADTKTDASVRARAVEAAGKIAAANVKDEKAKQLGEAILDVLDAESKKTKADKSTVLFGLTAILRVKPEEGDFIAAKFLTNLDARIRADAANTLSRLRAKNADEQLRAMLLSDDDAIARANAARALGAAEDKDAFNLLLEAAATDEDSRVRVSAIRSLGNLKDKRAADKLLERGETLLADYKKSKFVNPSEKSELLEIATTLGRIMPNTNDEKAIKFLQSFREADKFRSPETEIAFAQIAPKIYVNSATFTVPQDNGFSYGFFNAGFASYYVEKYQESLSSFAQGFGAIADNQSADKETVKKAQDYIMLLTKALPVAIVFTNPEVQLQMGEVSLENMSAENKAKIAAATPKFNLTKKYILNAFPEVLRALGQLKPEKYENEIAKFLLNKDVIVVTTNDGKKFASVLEYQGDKIKESEYDLLNKDAIVRATAAELIGEIKEVSSFTALESAFDFAVSEDKEINDAQLAILDAAVKKNKVTSKKILIKALNSPDFLVRQKAIQLIKQNDLPKDFSNIEGKFETLKPYDPKTGTKLGQILNTQADYVRAVSRKSARAILTTEKGTFAIEFAPEDAPLTVDNFIKLARANYFNGLTIHRVVPNFVMQDGDPRGDGNGGPDWEIRDEINMIPYERGAVGMALSGKDTGGSQWFVCHSPQPHLDGGYTVFGRVNETDMKVVDNLVRGDKILSVKIVEGTSPKNSVNKRGKK